jgi:hypothetical protein
MGKTFSIGGYGDPPYMTIERQWIFKDYLYGPLEGRADYRIGLQANRRVR